MRNTAAPLRRTGLTICRAPPSGLSITTQSPLWMPRLAAVVDELAGRGVTLTGREVLKTAPRGVPADHPRIALLRHKGLVTWQRWPVGAWLGTRKAKDRVVDFLRASAPVQDWLDTHVGAPVDAR